MPDSRHLTLTPNTVATVTLDYDYDNVEIVNVDGTATVYFTIDGSTPTVEGNGTIVLPAAVSGWSTEYNRPRGSAAEVRLISTGSPKIAVRGW